MFLRKRITGQRILEAQAELVTSAAIEDLHHKDVGAGLERLETYNVLHLTFHIGGSPDVIDPNLTAVEKHLDRIVAGQPYVDVEVVVDE